ncbi:TlpA family protein disulfide reductase [Paenibacillus camelliae]|uniref:TlpA family protein disulfide reductase n=1 Tax=Paenibacillus camelliae TaxID=512410 RepID=UPI00203EEA2E|nr:TlpA disulfide reductase family protein [Paenibacillus camelliae]MCM3635451.1 TlpA family protein disulfide reductase [Paenibacillus camelliae]
MKKISSILVIALLLGGFAIYEFVQSGKQSSTSAQSIAMQTFKPKAGELSFANELPNLNDVPISFGGEQEGKLQLINFWASWCGPCELEAPDLQKLHQKYGDKLAMFGVNATDTDNERQARKFVDDFGFTFEVLFDRDGDITKLYRVNTFPTSFIIDDEGVIKERINGVITLEQWEKIIDSHLINL